MAVAGGRMPPGPKPSLSRQQIITAALELLKADGAGALSFRRLGTALGVSGMTLYNYFPSKQALEDAIVEHVMPAPPSEIDPDVPWYDHVRTYLVALHDAFVDNPGTADMFVARSMSSRAMDLAREFILSQLAVGGLPDHTIARAAGVFNRYVAGSVLVASQHRVPSAAVEIERLANLPEAEFPVLRRLAREYAVRSGDDQVPMGLDLLIRGLRDLVEAE